MWGVVLSLKSSAIDVWHGLKCISLMEAVVQRCSVKNIFLEICQNSQGNTCASKKETLAQVFSCQFCAISKNTFSYRTPSVAASVLTYLPFWLVIFLLKNFTSTFYLVVFLKEYCWNSVLFAITCIIIIYLKQNFVSIFFFFLNTILLYQWKGWKYKLLIICNHFAYAKGFIVW